MHSLEQMQCLINLQKLIKESLYSINFSTIDIVETVSCLNLSKTHGNYLLSM